MVFGTAVCLAGCRVHARGRNVDGRGSTRCHCTKTSWMHCLLDALCQGQMARRRWLMCEGGTGSGGGMKTVKRLSFSFSWDSVWKKKEAP